MEWAVFIGGALITLLGAYGVVTRSNPVHAAISLIGTFFGIAVLFIAQDAEFLAAMQVIVYAGAIVVLFLFVIMLLGVDSDEDLDVEPLAGQRTAGLIAAAALAIGLTGIIAFGAITGLRSVTGSLDQGYTNPVAVGRVLFTDYVWAFEITSVLLVIAVVGGVVLARHRPDVMVDDDLPGDDLSADDTDDAVVDADGTDESAATEEVAP